ncbi:ferredoxin family protein [Prosthecochloris sp. HL-130-GSB]|jgi:NAD-dependent dihydropyrimidine dehydrogenase PreA subunit|uniref:4Fe-4S dicluster domain-containing protein n=1 Tax=Prosthecochloris sp. HL-130-GSB TaxID=1974213 RepID=UPI000A1C033C|nr:ferredoxin family protein [Prosthecochloris sp. HL-130-GSB]ARM30228.1 4Fe-4S ferredoxin [Prosthecochloris sp. HL-130-GSB]MBO8091832.1 ferredoxin family protein [Prosthecochloris sp.]
MLIFDCYFGRCEKPSCDGCLFKPVRALRLKLKSRAMGEFDDAPAAGQEAWRKEVESLLASGAQEPKEARKAAGKRKKRLLAPREDIPWYPTINPDLCNGCADCKVLCKPGVFEPGPPDPEGIHRPKFIVAHPYNCIVLCDRCVPVCTSGAIKLPPKDDFEKYVEYVD